jgi:hypothetical protein
MVGGRRGEKSGEVGLARVETIVVGGGDGSSGVRDWMMVAVRMRAWMTAEERRETLKDGKRREVIYIFEGFALHNGRERLWVRMVLRLLSDGRTIESLESNRSNMRRIQRARLMW